MTDEPIRVLIVDDHPMFRAGLAAILAEDEGVSVAGQATDAEESIVLAADLLPDVVLMDLNLPGRNGIEATREIVGTSPHIAVVMLTMFEDDDSVFAAMRAGARGYLLKGATGPDIRRAVHVAGHGEAIFGAAVAQRMISYFSRSQRGPAIQGLPGLTQREHEVLNLIAAGANNTQITNELVLSPKTVRNHISNIFSKLQVADRAQAIVLAREAGLGGRDGTPGTG